MVREVRQTKSKEQKGFGLPNCVLAFAKSISISYLKPLAWLPCEARWLLFLERILAVLSHTHWLWPPVALRVPSFGLMLERKE